MEIIEYETGMTLMPGVKLQRVLTLRVVRTFKYIYMFACIVVKKKRKVEYTRRYPGLRAGARVTSTQLSIISFTPVCTGRQVDCILHPYLLLPEVWPVTQIHELTRTFLPDSSMTLHTPVKPVYFVSNLRFFTKCILTYYYDFFIRLRSI